MIDLVLASKFAAMALNCVHQEYPNKLAHHLESSADVRAPHELTPAFYGCYDWHSAVHGHWLLARLVREQPTAPFAADARKALAISLTQANLKGEAAYMLGKGRASWERPYGLAWLLQLGVELRQWNDPEAKQWAAALAPVEQASVKRLTDWLPKLTRPIRSGEHSQTAFGLALAWDWARVAKNDEFAALLKKRIPELYGADKSCPLAYEPSGEDFLSPCLAEADLMRRVLPPKDFAAWLTTFLPQIPSKADTSWLRPGEVLDAEDGKLVHLHGLNLSRAWMLEGIASALPSSDARLSALRACAAEHKQVGLAGVEAGHYMGGHWLGSFATYLTTERGLR